MDHGAMMVMLDSIRITNVCPSEHAILYSIGLPRFSLPELVVTGLSLRQGAGYINVMAVFMAETGVPQIGTAFDGPMTGPSKLVEMSPQWRQIMPRIADHKAYQLLWPDRKGAFPCDAEFDREFARQVLL